MDTSAQYVSFQQQPNNRGTYDILISCSLTMVLCIWTALHLNIACDKRTLAKKGRLLRFWYDDRIRKVRWVAMGLFAPELVVYNAWMQRQKVNQITRNARKSQQLAKELGMPQVFEWTQYHSWYLIMGGFYFKTKINGTLDEFIPGSPDLILTTSAMDLLTKTSPPLLPEIEADVIKDHSKADVVAKALAFLQALYQFLSVIARLALKLPVSQLEVNTFGHILCAFAILSIWFKKPKDIKVRTQIRDEWANPLSAYMWMCSKYSWTAGANCLEIHKLFPKPRKSTVVDKVPLERGQQNGARAEDRTTEKLGNDICVDFHSEVKHVDTTLSLRQSPRSTENTSSNVQLSAEPQLKAFAASNDSSPSISITTLNENLGVVRPTPRSSLGDNDGLVQSHLSSQPTPGWTLWALPRIDPVQDRAAFEYVMRPTLKEQFQPAEIEYDNATTANRVCLAMSYVRYWSLNTVNWSNPSQVCLGVKAYSHSVRPPVHQAALITDHVSDWFKEPESRVWYSTKVVPALSMALLTICYGALHGWAWQAHFPTKTESIMWRISAVAIASSGTLFAFERICTAISSHLTDRVIEHNYEAGHGWQDYGQRAPLLWLPRRMRLLFWPLLAIRKGLFQSLATITAAQSAEFTITDSAILAVAGLLMAAFTTARIFLVVESFISLRSMTPQIYETPNWPQWFPHL